MLFRPEISDTQFPLILQKFVAITGIEEWERRIAWIDRQLEQNHFLKAYLNQIYSLELEFAGLLYELAETGKLNTRLKSVERYRLFAFITATVMIHERLTPRGQNRLRGMILGGLRDKGLTPLQQEISVAAHLLSRGFDVCFSDMETGSGFDFLARKNGVELEVECKRVGLDLGRKIPRLETLQLHKGIFEEVEKTFTNLRCGLFLRVTLPDRLSSNTPQQQAIASIVGKVFRTGVPHVAAQCRIELDQFEIPGSPFEKKPNDADKPNIRTFIEKRFHSTNRELFILGTAGKRALVVCVESDQPDSLLSNLFDELSQAVRSQFSKQRPGVLCVQFIDMSNKQILRIDSASGHDSGPKRPSPLLIKTSGFLSSDKRRHVLAIAFRGHGLVSKTSERIGNVLRDSIQEQGNAYFVTNDRHPLANDRRYSIFSVDSAPSRILIMKHRVRSRAAE